MEVLIALFSIAALVWMIPIIQSGRLFAGPLIILGMGTVFGPAFFAINGPIQISVDRVVWLAMFGFIAISWRGGNTSIPSLTRMDWVVIGLVGWLLLSVFRGDPVPTGKTPPIAKWIFYIAMPAGMYAMARFIQIRRKDIHWLIGGAIFLSAYLSVTALLEARGLSQFVFPRFIADPQVWEFYGRGRGPLMNPSGNGILISIGLAASAIMCIYSKRHGKMIYGLLSVLMLVGVYATLTRSAWLGAACVAAVIGLIHLPRWVRVLGLAAVILLGGASAVGLKDQLMRIKRDKNLTASDAQKSVQLRPLLAVVAWEMFQDKPMMGHGFGHYFAHNEPFHNDRSYDLPLETARPYAQHNVILSILVDAGAIGAGTFVAWIAMLIAIGWRLARKVGSVRETRWVGILILSTLTAYLCNGMFQDVMIIPMVHMFVFFLAGVAVTVFQRGLVADAPIQSPIHAPNPAGVFERGSVCPNANPYAT